MQRIPHTPSRSSHWAVSGLTVFIFASEEEEDFETSQAVAPASMAARREAGCPCQSVGLTVGVTAATVVSSHGDCRHMELGGANTCNTSSASTDALPGLGNASAQQRPTHEAVVQTTHSGAVWAESRTEEEEDVPNGEWSRRRVILRVGPARRVARTRNPAPLVHLIADVRAAPSRYCCTPRFVPPARHRPLRVATAPTGRSCLWWWRRGPWRRLPRGAPGQPAA